MLDQNIHGQAKDIDSSNADDHQYGHDDHHQPSDHYADPRNDRHKHKYINYDPDCHCH